MISKQSVVLIARLIPWANQCELHKAMAGHKFGLAPHSSLVEYLEEEARNLHDAYKIEMHHVYQTSSGGATGSIGALQPLWAVVLPSQSRTGQPGGAGEAADSKTDVPHILAVYLSITVTDLYISESHQSTACKIIACDGAIPLLQVLKLCIVNWDNIDIVDDTPLLLPTRLFLHWIHVAALSILTLALFFPFNCMDSMAPDDYAAVGNVGFEAKFTAGSSSSGSFSSPGLSLVCLGSSSCSEAKILCWQDRLGFGSSVDIGSSARGKGKGIK
ncbi:hypothetical protein B0H13DRAFT_1851699 [Mycena leptocephala]|nr:hypothetical protein B0H13DRAFT_1851699 [Mycena leptocephala]